MPTRDEIIDVYGPQLGELAWHSLHVDSRIAAMSEQHAASILRAAGVASGASAAPPRILEVGAYAHYGAHRAAAVLGGVSVAHDVSPTSLLVGRQGAREAGIAAEPTLVAGDFHDLPFETGSFDVVFCASSIHHTFRPRRVLREMMRVLRPGGVLQLENEPIGRALCFYGFRGNRAEAFTPFEAELARRGTLFTFASPFPGSRPEAMFGMIENERIPLDMVLGVLAEAGDLQWLELRPQRAEFEQRVLALPCDDDLEAGLAGLLLSEAEAVRPLLTEADRLLGARLPTADDVWRLSYLMAPELRRLSRLNGREAEHQAARLFGAGLQATVVKRGSAAPSAEMFRRRLAAQGGVLNDLPSLPGVALQLMSRALPAIEDADLPTLETVYPAGEWEPFREDNGLLSMLNLQPSSRIVLPRLASDAMLLLRFYAVATEAPYRIVLCDAEGGTVASVLVVQSESLLLREIVPGGAQAVLLATRALDGVPLTLPRHIRLGIGRLIPVTVSELAAAAA